MFLFGTNRSGRLGAGINVGILGGIFLGILALFYLFSLLVIGLIVILVCAIIALFMMSYYWAADKLREDMREDKECQEITSP